LLQFLQSLIYYTEGVLIYSTLVESSDSFLSFITFFAKTWLPFVYKLGAFIEPGLNSLFSFIGEHLFSGMVPAFFLAGAIGVFLDKQRITKYMGKDAKPWYSYPIAALSGGVLTVCSCGVIPIFTSIWYQGAGIGPAFTFLMASPAVNIIALSYTHSLLGKNFLIGRTLAVFFSAILIGLGMNFIFKKDDPRFQDETDPDLIFVEEETGYTDIQLLIFFAMLLFLMMLTTGFLDPAILKIAAFLRITSDSFAYKYFARLTAAMLQVVFIIFYSKHIFEKEEIQLWLDKTKNLVVQILPKILLGLFLCGVLFDNKLIISMMSIFDDNTILSNLLASVVGSLMYFGTIVGATIVQTLHSCGMHAGPSLALLLTGPSVSLPSIIAIVPIVGRKKALAYLSLVILTGALSGYIYGKFF